MSDLTACFNALAALTVSAAGKTPRVFNYDAAPTQVDTAQLPCRLLLPLGPRADARAVAATTFGAGMSATTWQLTDLLLWEAAGQGRGLIAMSPVLVEYAQAYVAMIERARFKLGRGATVENLQIEPTMAEYPAESGAQFYAVEVTLTVKDIA